MNDGGQIISSAPVTLTGNRGTAPSIFIYESSPAGANLVGQTRDFITTNAANAHVVITSSIAFFSPGETANNNFIINTQAGTSNITLQGAIDGNWNNFVLLSGGGTIATATTAPMTEVATLTLQDNSTASTGPVNLDASIAVDWIETFPKNYSVSITGSSNTVGVRSYYKYGNTQHPVFWNTGGVRFGNDATDYIWFRERLTSIESTTTVTGVIEANFTIAFSNVIVSNTASLNSTGGGDVNINGNIRGSGSTLRFGENTAGFMNYRITGNVTLGTLTTFADDTSITFLEDVTLETPTTLLNQRIQLGDAADDITSVAGIFNASAVSLLSLGGTVVTTGGAITISTVTLLAPVVLDTTSGGTSAAISVTRIVGNSSLAVDAGTTADATIAIAEMAHLTGGLTVRNAGGLVTLGALGGSASGPVTIANSQNGVRFTNALTASDLTVTSTAAGRSILFEDGYLVRIGTFSAASGGYNVDIRSSEFVVVNDTDFFNTAALALGNNATDSLTFAGGLGAVSQSGITLAGTLLTTNTPIDLGNFTLAASSTIDSGSAATSVINLAAVNMAGFDLTLDSGTNAAAALSITSVTATGSAKLTVREAGAFTVSGAVNVPAVELRGITAAASVGGNFTATSLTTVAGNYSLAFLGLNTQVTNAVTLLNSGGVTLGNIGAALNFTGGLTSTASVTSVNGTFNTSNAPATFNALSITGSSSINTGTGNVSAGSIAVAANSLTVLTTTGTVSVTGAITGAGSLTLQNGGSSGNVALTGNVSLGSLTFGAAAYRVTMTGSTNSITNSVGFVNTGGVILGDGGDTFTFDGGFTSTASATTLAAAFTTSSDNVALGTVTLAGTTSFTTAGGAVSANSIDGNSSVTATLGAGNLTVGAIGATTALSSITVASAATVTFQSTDRINGNLTQSAGTGTTTLNGISGSGISGNLSLTTSNVQFATAPITVGGTVTIAATAVNLASGTGLTVGGNIAITAGSGSFTQSGTAPITTTSSTTSAISITVNSTGNAVLGRLNADAGTLTVTLGGSGAMSDNNDVPSVGVNFSAKNITLVGAAGSIGSGNPLEFLSPNTPTAPTGAGIVNGSTLGGTTGGIARLDFGGNMNFTTTNFTHVPSNKLFTANGFGFAATALASQATQSTGYSVSTINLYRDGVTGRGTAQARFRYSITNGTYSVRLYVGHPTMETSTRVEAEGGVYWGQSGRLSRNVFSTITIGDIVVSDGVLDLVFRTPAGYTGYWLVCGLDLAESIASLPTTAPQRLDGVT
ncbi:MAG: beta strand repeat-containing protein, partial [Planctomyces sp.]